MRGCRRWRQSCRLERTEPWAAERMPREEGSGDLVEEFDLRRWSVGEGLRLLGGEFQTPADGSSGGEVGDEGEYFHLSATERA